jgi:hypothetical protein
MLSCPDWTAKQLGLLSLNAYDVAPTRITQQGLATAQLGALQLLLVWFGDDR